MGASWKFLKPLSINTKTKNAQKKCTDGSINAIKAGRYTHPAPRGYVNGRDANNQRNIILSDNEDFVRAIAASWKLIANGLSCEDARKEVNGMLKEMGGENNTETIIFRYDS